MLKQELGAAFFNIYSFSFCFNSLLSNWHDSGLGRRSSLPAIRYTSIGFIELWRCSSDHSFIYVCCDVSHVLTDGTYVDKLIRVLIAITLFEAAYMAEVIRGGLQALPKGQYEAAKSLGMGY